MKKALSYEKHGWLRRLTLSGVLLALGIVLPLLTGQIKEIGDTLLPMHLPVLLCGFLAGWRYGGLVGLILPFLRSLLFSMPPMFPNAVWMAAELCAYGIVAGLLYSLLKKRGLVGIYISLIGAQLIGRVVWGAVKWILLFSRGGAFTFLAFLTGGFVDAALGIVLQLIIIPLIVSLEKRIRNRA